MIGFEPFDMLPDRETIRELGISISPEIEAQLEAHDEQGGDRRSFVGGWPRWLQGPDYARCKVSGSPCCFVAQLAMGTFGSDGVGYVLRSPAVPSLLTLVWKR